MVTALTELLSAKAYSLAPHSPMRERSQGYIYLWQSICLLHSIKGKYQGSLTNVFCLEPLLMTFQVSSACHSLRMKQYHDCPSNMFKYLYIPSWLCEISVHQTVLHVSGCRNEGLWKTRASEVCVPCSGAHCQYWCWAEYLWTVWDFLQLLGVSWKAAFEESSISVHQYR